MKFCLGSRVSPQYLKKADQIKVQPRDIKQIYSLLEEYPDKEIVLLVTNPPTREEVKEFNQIKILSKDKFILAFNFFPLYWHCGDCRWYANYPVESFSEANALIDLRSECIRLGSPLFFQMDKITFLRTKIRLVPNRPYLSVVPRENGICGQWIRPEDLHLYEELLPDAIVEFDSYATTQEEALYRIYAEQGEWPGPLNYLVEGLNTDALNRLLEPGIGLARLNCGHKCQDPTGSCHVCPNAFKLAKMLEEKHAIDKN